jgi:hypothetical protein
MWNLIYIMDANIILSENGANTTGWIVDESTPLSHPPLQCSLTSFAFGSTTSTVDSFGTVSGLPQVVNALAATPDGIDSMTWLPDGTSSWLPATTPQVMQDVTNTPSIASHSYASAYAIFNGTLTEFVLSASDFTTWSIKDTVATT